MSTKPMGVVPREGIGQRLLNPKWGLWLIAPSQVTAQAHEITPQKPNPAAHTGLGADKGLGRLGGGRASTAPQRPCGLTVLPRMPSGRGMAVGRGSPWSRNTLWGRDARGVVDVNREGTSTEQGIPVEEAGLWRGDALGAVIAMWRGCPWGQGCLRGRDAHSAAVPGPEWDGGPAERGCCLPSAGKSACRARRVLGCCRRAPIPRVRDPPLTPTPWPGMRSPILHPPWLGCSPEEVAWSQWGPAVGLGRGTGDGGTRQ